MCFTVFSMFYVVLLCFLCVLLCFAAFYFVFTAGLLCVTAEQLAQDGPGHCEWQEWQVGSASQRLQEVAKTSEEEGERGKEVVEGEGKGAAGEGQRTERREGGASIRQAAGQAGTGTMFEVKCVICACTLHENRHLRTARTR